MCHYVCVTVCVCVLLHHCVCVSLCVLLCVYYCITVCVCVCVTVCVTVCVCVPLHVYIQGVGVNGEFLPDYHGFDYYMVSISKPCSQYDAVGPLYSLVTSKTLY